MTTAIDKTTTNTQSRKGRTPRKQDANVVNFFKPLSVDEARAELTREYDSNDGIIDALLENAENDAFLDNAWTRPEMIAASDERDVVVNLSTDKGINFTSTIIHDPEDFVDQLEHVTDIKRNASGSSVTVSMVDIVLPERYDVLGSQIAHYLKGFRFMVAYYRDGKNNRHALLMIPHTGIPVDISDEFSVRLRDGVLYPLHLMDVPSLSFNKQASLLGYTAKIRSLEDVEIYDGELLDGTATARYWGLQTRFNCLEDRSTPKDIQQAPDKGRPLVDGMIQIGDYGVIYSPPNTGKTTFAAYLGYCVANGMEMLGFMRSKRAHVIYADLEFNNIDGMLQACEEHHGARTGWRDRFHIVNTLPDLGNDEAVDAWCVKMRAKTNNEPALVIIDTQRKAARNSTLSGQPLKENGNDDMTVIANAMMRISCRMNGATFSLHHTTKANEEVMSGGGALEAGVTSAFVLTVPDKSKPNCLNLAATKRRGNGMPKGLYYGIEFVDVRIMTADEEKTAIADADEWFGETMRSDCHKAPEHGISGASFDTGPQTHAKTVYPKLFDAFEVKRGAISANAAKKDGRLDRMKEVREYMASVNKPVSANNIVMEFSVSRRIANDYLKTMEASCIIKCVEPAAGRNGAKYQLV
ncbi:AAA family ATPase [Citrobacter amalonaticus]|uniref:AAA family ATPase n=1 Tax=Citrobacter sp. CFNIH10 TaxID=1920110 RepID=UPI000CEBF3A1|nr:AAA family ATPase [Citrobacter sp. CFNIH10]AUZ67090.1 hypothetical protein C2U53_26475 [Citrobacter sp. CFNIH10]MBU5644624.1 helicase RepA family protein [Pluralibacter sp. S54_ASV_43]